MPNVSLSRYEGLTPTLQKTVLSSYGIIQNICLAAALQARCVYTIHNVRVIKTENAQFVAMPYRRRNIHSHTGGGK